MLIESLLDTDLYKFTMMQVVLHHFPGAQVEYVFKCRSEGVDLGPHVEDIRASIADLCKMVEPQTSQTSEAFAACWTSPDQVTLLTETSAYCANGPPTL